MPEALWSGKHRALRLAMSGFIALAWTASARAEDCAPEPQGEGRIAAVIDARTLQLDDGRVIRLAGLAPLYGAWSERAAAILAALATGHPASLHGDEDGPDRYGRQHAWVFLEGDPSPLQEKLAAAGGGVRDLAVQPAPCRDGLESAENTARVAQLGLWNAAKFAKNTESPDDISAEIGHFTVVEGRVRSVRQAGGTIYLNFGRRWIEGFAVMVPGRTFAAFEASGRLQGVEGLKKLEGQWLRVRGYVIKRGGPRIEVTSPEQIEVIGERDVAATGAQD